MKKNERAEVLATLRAAKGLVQKGWIQGTSARDARGAAVYSRSEEAVSFCSVGAIRHSTHDAVIECYAGRALLRAIKAPAIGPWNDEYGRKQEEVVEAFEKAVRIVQRLGRKKL
jgi:uncharacterized protein (DUF1501 family)